MIDEARVQEVKNRLADKFTSAELAELLLVPVEDIIEEYWHLILKNSWILEEVGVVIDGTE